MQIANPLTRGGPIAGFESFVDRRNEEEELLQVLADSDSNEGSDGKTALITDSQPSVTQPVMSQSQEHSHHYSSLNLDAMQQSTFTGLSGPVGGGWIMQERMSCMLGNNFLIRKLCYLWLKITTFEDPLNTRYWSLIR